jgi:hypothetical protein
VTWLSKSEVNTLYYDTVAGDIVFQTEASVGHHPAAAARLVAARARALGLGTVRIVELGANDARFARALLCELRMLHETGQTGLERIDYLAVELARDALERAAREEEELRVGRNVLRPTVGGSSMLALIVVEGGLAANLGLVHSEAAQFVRENTRQFDVAILNELLDDMPYRAYFSDAGGRRFEAVPLSRDEDGRWKVRIEAHDVATTGLAPGTMTAHSPECVEVVAGLAAALAPGGMLLVHDYGFAEPSVPLQTYDRPLPSLPGFAEMEFPDGDGGFPRSFFRVFGNDARRVVQVTNDVNFAELAALLEPHGRVSVIPHGSQILNAGRELAKGQGSFLSEFGLLEPDDDVDQVLARLGRDQAQLRADYAREYFGGHPSLFLDLIYVKESGPRDT